MTEKRLYHGAAWYPELWDLRTRTEDIRLMKEAGISVVRIGEFAWGSMEPDEGAIDLSFFVSILDDLHRAGIRAVMCTPTATPPVWLSHNHPERMFVDESGRTMSHGARQHACTNNAYYREKSFRIVERVARAVGRHPALAGWQLDNEFKCHVAECMCATCKTLWHEWLEKKYGGIAALNDAWGADIWSEAYRAFDEVPQPLATPFLHNASLSTMYRLFSQEKICEFAHAQTGIIRKYSSAPITHNSNVAFRLDNANLFDGLDFASFDSYADFDNWADWLFKNDLWRNFKRGVPYWVMETSSSFAAATVSHGIPHPRGYLAAEAVSAWALGAQGFCYWLWRQQRAGCELPHSAVLTAWGKPGLGWNDVLATEKARAAIEPVMTASRPRQAEVAVVWSDRAKAYWETETLGEMQYRGLATSFYALALATGLHRDLITEKTDLSGYRLLFTPFIPYLDDECVDRAARMVASGGIWVIGPLTGWRTAEHTVPTDSALGHLDTVTGLTPCAMWPTAKTGATGTAFGLTAPLTLWSFAFDADALNEAGAENGAGRGEGRSESCGEGRNEARGEGRNESCGEGRHEARGEGRNDGGPMPAGGFGPAVSVGKIDNGVAEGFSFIVERKYGKGKFVFLGSLPSAPEGDLMIERAMLHYAAEAGVSVRTGATAGTIVAPRIMTERYASPTGFSVEPGSEFWCAVNMDGSGGSVPLPPGALDMLSGQSLPEGMLSVARYGYRLIAFGRKEKNDEMV